MFLQKCIENKMENKILLKWNVLKSHLSNIPGDDEKPQNILCVVEDSPLANQDAKPLIHVTTWHLTEAINIKRRTDERQRQQEA